MQGRRRCPLQNRAYPNTFLKPCTMSTEFQILSQGEIPPVGTDMTQVSSHRKPVWCAWCLPEAMICTPCRKNEDDLRWVAEETWIFQRNFDMPNVIGQYLLLNTELILDGVDTIATVCLNGTRIADLQNAHRCSLEPDCMFML